MEKTKLIQCLRQLNLDNAKGASYELFLENQLEETYEKLEVTEECIISDISDIADLNFSKNVNLEWNYICVGFYVLKSLSKEAEQSTDVFLSVRETKDLKSFIKNLVIIGICTKLQPNLPFKMKSNYFESGDIFWDYNVLKCTTFGLTEFLRVPFLRLLILPDNLKEILVALYQICYCPLNKSIEIYEKLMEERKLFVKIFDGLRLNIHPQIFVKENMLCLHKSSPAWFKKRLSVDLTNILRSKDGVETVVASMFGDGESNAQNWKILEIFSKLILECEKFPDFKENILKQLFGLLEKRGSLVETIFAHLTKSFYQKNPIFIETVFIKEIVAPFYKFTQKSEEFDQQDVTEIIGFTSRMLHRIFIENMSILPTDLIRPIINVLFKLYLVTLNSFFKTINNDLKDLILLFLDQNQTNFVDVFDVLLFDLESGDIFLVRNDVSIEIEQDKIKLKILEQTVKYSTAESLEGMRELLKTKQKLLNQFFCYLLNCVTDEKKYFQKSSRDLLEIEETVTSVYMERKIVTYKILAELAAEKSVQKQLNENPAIIVDYLKTNLEDKNTESSFTLLMILDNLLSNCSKNNKKQFETLLQPLKKVRNEIEDAETKLLLNNILESLQENRKENSKTVEEDEESELDRIVDDICDPLLPTRGHGLLSLTKLIEKRDKEIMERKRFVLNILQQNITNEDSFIYLNAINGLAAMADIFPDTILNLLCDEYSDSNRKDTADYSEVRMKLGEVLVKITKILGEMAPKYKPLLLNTFLIGTKDEDDLIRASSLSNLGEICRVLGYKLGSMFTEVLVCVHAIIATDKSPQARRAAVTVIRQLFIGLDRDIIAFFKEDILPVYRTLKQIYNNDKDDVMRLQAQLALEELNESMKNFVFPNLQLDFDKKVVLLN